jgi:acyl-CoA synthetase (AMP-forming)/AMP-acid ligase II
VQPYLVHQFLAAATARSPGALALVTHEPNPQRVTYAELTASVHRVAAQLIGIGVQPGDRVALLAANGVEWVSGWFGALMIGAVVVPINTASDPHSLVHYVTDAGASVLLVGPRYERVVAQAGARLGPITIVASPGAVANLRKAIPSGTIVAAADGDPDPGPPRVRLVDLDLAAIIYTSGSTGKPRGAVLSHRNLVANIRSIVDYLPLGADERVLALLPFYYVYGLSVLHIAVAVGGTLVVENRFQYPAVALDTLAREQCTGFAGVPSTFAILMNRSNFGERARTELPALRWVTQAGGGMSPALIRQVAEVRGPRQLFVMYGATEASARLSYVAPAELAESVGSIGRAIVNVDLTVRRPDATPCAVDETGELYARGSNIMVGYWNDPDETARVLGRYGYRTGDLARCDSAGRFWLVGRARDMLKVGGHRVAAKEIEDAILEHPGVHEAAVIGIADDILGDTLRAYVVAKAEGLVDPQGLGGFLKQRLPAYKIPAAIELRADLPKNESGKVMKEVLRAAAAHPIIKADPDVGN